MTTCPECGSRDLYKYSDDIFYHKHEWVDCNECSCLWIKVIDTNEWTESSSIAMPRYVKENVCSSAPRKI